ncbi:hypothetical protein TIFTF001_031010 [Ficus carica]|uniref:Uncharacterized protein n=1 Tax=Ficus carica TaxID=3494 RepID=A0AA88J3N1_FICCA|nr:hypothetical protein TIFTF001_031010 [Ficus carica]
MEHSLSNTSLPSQPPLPPPPPQQPPRRFPQRGARASAPRLIPMRGRVLKRAVKAVFFFCLCFQKQRASQSCSSKASSVFPS